MDQADQLRQLARAAVAAEPGLAPGAPIIAVSGGRPGVGATTLATQLARELAPLGKRVVLIDANLTHKAGDGIAGPRIRDFLAGPRHDGSIADVLAGRRRAIETLQDIDDGVRLLPGCPSGVTPELSREAIDRFFVELAALTRQFDVVLLDAGAGMNAWIDRLWQAASQILLVATPEDDVLLETYAAVKLAEFHRLQKKLRPVVNRSRSESIAASYARRLAETCQRFLFLDMQPHLALPTLTGALSSNGASPLSPDDPFLRAVRLLAADLVGSYRAASLRFERSRRQPRYEQASPASAEPHPASQPSVEQD